MKQILPVAALSGKRYLGSQIAKERIKDER